MEFSENHFKVMDRFMVILPPEALFSSREVFDKHFEIGTQIGRGILRMIEKYYLERSRKIIEFSFKLLSLFGFGKFDIFSEDEEKILVEVEDSPLVKVAVSQNFSGKCCKLIEGILTVLFSFVLNSKKVKVVEVSCKAEGNPKCIFKVSKPSPS